MARALAILALALCLGIAHASEDPTTSLSGVIDLSECPPWVSWAHGNVGRGVEQCFGRLPDAAWPLIKHGEHRTWTTPIKPQQLASGRLQQRSRPYRCVLARWRKPSGATGSLPPCLPALLPAATPHCSPPTEQRLRTLTR